MSDSARQILNSFQALPPKEQHELLVVMLTRSQDSADARLADDELTAIADQLFQTLDQEECDGAITEAR